METSKKSMIKSAMTYGLMMGVVSIAFVIVTYIANLVKPPFWFNLLSYAATIGIIIYGTTKYRNEELGGYISYGKALKFSVLICVFGSIISTVYMLLHITSVDPEFLNKLIMLSEEEMLNSGLSYDQVEAAMAMSKKFMSPTFITISTFLGSVLMGVIFSLVTSIFLKREKPLFQ